MQTQSRLVFERWNLRVPGIHSIGRYINMVAAPGLPPHQHPGCVEISFLARGCQYYGINGHIYEVKGGEQYVSQPGEIHDTGDAPEEKGELYWVILDVENPPDDFLYLVPKMAEKLLTQLRRLPSRSFVAHKDCQSTFDAAFDTIIPLRKPAQSTGIFLKNAVPDAVSANPAALNSVKTDYSFELLNFAGLVTAILLQTIDASRAQMRQISPSIQASLDMIGKNTGVWLEVARMAEAAGLPESTFKLRFRDEVGLPPADYMLRQKIAAAKERLCRPDSNIAEVAESLGFSSSQYFATVFKRYTNSTPSDFIMGHAPKMVEIINVP